MHMQTKLIVGILAITLGACAKEKPAEDKLTAAEAKSIAQDGYLFGLPLVYIAVQADAADQRRQARSRTGAIQPVWSPPRVSRREEQQDRRDERRHAVFAGQRRPHRRADRAGGAADGRQSLVDHAGHRRVERRAGRARLSHARRQGRQLRARRPELQGHASRRSGRDPRRHQPRC